MIAISLLRVQVTSDSKGQQGGYYTGTGDWSGKPIRAMVLCSRGDHRWNTQKG